MRSPFSYTQRPPQAANTVTTETHVEAIEMTASPIDSRMLTSPSEIVTTPPAFASAETTSWRDRPYWRDRLSPQQQQHDGRGIDSHRTQSTPQQDVKSGEMKSGNQHPVGEERRRSAPRCFCLCCLANVAVVRRACRVAHLLLLTLFFLQLATFPSRGTFLSRHGSLVPVAFPVAWTMGAIMGLLALVYAFQGCTGCRISKRGNQPTGVAPTSSAGSVLVSLLMLLTSAGLTVFLLMGVHIVTFGGSAKSDGGAVVCPVSDSDCRSWLLLVVIALLLDAVGTAAVLSEARFYLWERPTRRAAHHGRLESAGLV